MFCDSFGFPHYPISTKPGCNENTEMLSRVIDSHEGANAMFVYFLYRRATDDGFGPSNTHVHKNVPHSLHGFVFYVRNTLSLNTRYILPSQSVAFVILIGIHPRHNVLWLVSAVVRVKSFRWFVYLFVCLFVC